MASGLTKTKRRINSVQSTKKITKAMEMVATVKLRRFKDGFERGTLYINELRHALGEAFLRDEGTRSHYATSPEKARGSLYLLITSNLGLCAGYNANLYAYLDSFFDPEKDTLALIGEKGKAHYLRGEGVRSAIEDFAGLDLSMEPKDIFAAARKIRDEFNSGKYEKIAVIYTRYVNSLRFEPSTRVLLPVDIQIEEEPSEAYCPPLFEPAPRVMIHEILGQYLGGELYALLQESQLSEQASRRTAMENANDNADELLAKLTVEFNKARQAAITQEITEVINGANAQ